MEPQEGKMDRRSRRSDIRTKQERIATLAQQLRGRTLTTLAHHMDTDWLEAAYTQTRKGGAVGVDGVTAEEYAERLTENLKSLETRAKGGTYQAPPVRRVHIPKERGSTRPIGIPTFEDKVLQRAVLMLLEPVYETEFYDFSYGFRPKRSARQAADTLSEVLYEMQGGWVLDVDIRAFFDSLDRAKAREMLQQRVADGVIMRLVGKWLRAGVLEGGIVSHEERGTPQGGVISPLLANIYLHEVIDGWWVQQVLPRLYGRGELIRYADDLVMVFSERHDAERVQKALSQRVERYGLRLHDEKTRLVDFRKPHRDGSGPRPGSFDFLGFTYYWGRAQEGYWLPKRKTAAGRVTRFLSRTKEWMRRCRHLPIAEQAKALGDRLRGHINYFGVRGNSAAISRVHYAVRRMWHKWLGRRSQRAALTWEAFNRLLARYPLPPARLPRPAT
jgi:group II intron reverse transcriptase/maturase